jgi:hypothetical protein
MTNNKKIKGLVAGFCAVGMLAAISADEPVAAWNLARWGMTTAEIQAVYPNTKAVKGGEFDFAGRKCHGGLALADGIRVGGYDFEVRFLMDNSERLAAVQLTKDFKGKGNEFIFGESAFDTVKELLVQKYGKPSVETQKADKDGVLRISVWQSAKAQIKLGYDPTPLLRKSVVVLTYAMPGNTDKL